MEEGRLAYRVRTAETADATPLREAIGATLAHPDQPGHRESYRGAASRGDILILERFDRASQQWQVAGFIECHMRVDDNLSIHDIGTTGDQPQTGVVRYLLDQAFNSFRPTEAQVKIRRDATTWLEIFRSVPGFYVEGEEYRRPHYWTIWRWDRQRARDDEQQRTPRAQPKQPTRPRPPAPQGPANGSFQRGPQPASGPRPGGPRRPPAGGPRPGGGGGSGAGKSRPNGPGGPSFSRGPRPARPGGPRARRGGPRPGGGGPRGGAPA